MSTRLLAALLIFAAAKAVANPTAAELAELFMPPELDNLKLSPNGDYLGFIGRHGDQYTVGLYDFHTGKMELSKADDTIRPLDFWWKTPRRLLVKTSNYKLNALGYTAFDVDGRNSEDVWRLAKQAGRLFDAQVDDPRHVLMLNREEIEQVDLDTGHATSVDRAPAPTRLWVLDAQGRARATYEHDFRFGTADIWWKSAAEGAWRTQRFETGQRQFLPQGVDASGQSLWGWAWGGPKSAISLARFDTQSAQMESVEFIKGVGPTNLLMLGRTRQPVAVAYAQGAAVRLFALAEKYQDGVARLEKCFAGFFPLILDAPPDDKTWLVWIGNSRLPGAYFQFNRLTGQATLIGMSHNAAIAEDRLAAGEYFTFSQRSGGTLSARLWRPSGPSPLPLVVLCPRSLPADAALDVYQPSIQALVAQGFAVLQPNVRGTIGFGQTVDITQDADWATYVQQDLEDAVEELLRQKVVDPKSINLLGRDFGGVLALQIATKSNRFTAVATLNVPAKVDRQDLMRLTEESGVYALSGKLGGWLASARLAHDLSPIEQVVELKIPALFLHDEDSIKGRPKEDGRDIRSALTKARVPTKTGLAFSWSDKPKPPSLLARENASISMQIASFFRSPRAD